VGSGKFHDFPHTILRDRFARAYRVYTAAFFNRLIKSSSTHGISPCAKDMKNYEQKQVFLTIPMFFIRLTGQVPYNRWRAEFNARALNSQDRGSGYR
jgi:hypothetical protein